MFGAGSFQPQLAHASHPSVLQVRTVMGMSRVQGYCKGMRWSLPSNASGGGGGQMAYTAAIGALVLRISDIFVICSKPLNGRACMCNDLYTLPAWLLRQMLEHACLHCLQGCPCRRLLHPVSVVCAVHEVARASTMPPLTACYVWCSTRSWATCRRRAQGEPTWCPLSTLQAALPWHLTAPMSCAPPPLIRGMAIALLTLDP